MPGIVSIRALGPPNQCAHNYLLEVYLFYFLFVIWHQLLSPRMEKVLQFVRIEYSSDGVKGLNPRKLQQID